MRRALSGLLASCVLVSASVPAQVPGPLAERVQAVLSRPELRHAFAGFAVYDLDAGRLVYTLNGDKLFVPASTTKLLTIGTALELLGPDYRFHTRVYRTGPLGGDGTVDGDLVLVARGDPDLSGRLQPDGTLAFENEDHSYDGDSATQVVPGDPIAALRDLARQVAAAGVKRVRGHVRVDVSMFPEGERELGTGVVISPVMVNDNLVDVTLTPGATPGAPVAMVVSPSSAYATFVNTVTTGAAAARPRVRWSADSTTPDGNHVITVAGVMPAGRPGMVFTYAVPSPSRYAEVLFAGALRDAGVAAEPPAAGGVAGVDATRWYVPPQQVADHASAPFAEGAKVTLKVSQNLHASAMPFTLKGLLAPDDSGKTGFDLEREVLVKAGLDPSAAQQADGAGGDAHFTPEFMVRWLAWARTRPWGAAYRHALPILGRDGTLWNIQTTSPAAGHVFAKTGTFAVYDALNRNLLVTGKGLAGYIDAASGRHLAFAAYLNNVAVPQESDAIARIVGQALGELAAAAYETVR
jgi:D-alanyl-D-alanine carboxypeptidase/D-alanyl-D-alanine-endopeptidase (penicillin-binding protein 4)